MLVDAIQDMRDKVNYMFERIEKTPLREDETDEDFGENQEYEKEK